MSSANRKTPAPSFVPMPYNDKLRIAIVLAEWNQEITKALHEGCERTLRVYGVGYMETFRVPGAFELPAAAALLLANDNAAGWDAVVCLGCVIQGETTHHLYINHAVAEGLTQLSIRTLVPCIFGVLTPNNYEQALARAGGEHGNKGAEAASAAVRMARLRWSLQKGITNR